MFYDIRNRFSRSKNPYLDTLHDYIDKNKIFEISPFLAHAQIFVHALRKNLPWENRGKLRMCSPDHKEQPPIGVCFKLILFSTTFGLTVLQ